MTPPKWGGQTGGLASDPARTRPHPYRLPTLPLVCRLTSARRTGTRGVPATWGSFGQRIRAQRKKRGAVPEKGGVGGKGRRRNAAARCKFPGWEQFGKRRLRPVRVRQPRLSPGQTMPRARGARSPASILPRLRVISKRKRREKNKPTCRSQGDTGALRKAAISYP